MTTKNPVALDRILGFASLAAAFSILAAGESAAQVQSVVVGKDNEYEQTSPTDVHLRPIVAGQTGNFPYGFGADVDGQNIGSIAAPVLTGPINAAALGSAFVGGRLTYNSGDHGWRLGSSDWSAPSQANLNSIFADGTYTFTVGGATVQLQLTGNAFPNPPLLTLSGGSWVGEEYVIDPARPLVITTNTFTAYGSHSDDRIGIFVLGGTIVKPFEGVSPWSCASFPYGACQLHSSVPGSKTLTYTLPANTLVTGYRYFVGADFEAIVDQRPNAALPGSTNVAYYAAFTAVKLRAQTTVFPMTVTSNITATTASASAAIQPRPQDAGTQENIYVFAVAPATVVKSAIAKEAGGLFWTPRATTKDGVQCVLAQMNSAGQLQGASASSLQPAVSGVLNAQGQSVTILNNVSTPNVAGATFYVGYGQSASAMIASGVNQAALSIPGTVACEPQSPQTGWWWNPTEGGRGYSIEVQGNHIFFAAFHYDASGRATWNVASGATSIDGSLFTGDFLGVSGGQTLGGPYSGAPRVSTVGPITLNFSDASHGTMTWPGGTVAIERQNIVPNGLTTAPQTNQPESGWWWNPQESGRGFFMEWQNGYADIAGYMYDDAGNPVWYITVYPTPNARAFSGNWWQYANGQAMGGTYRPATQINGNVAAVTITFSGPDTAMMTLPNGRTTALTRQRF